MMMMIFICVQSSPWSDGVWLSNVKSSGGTRCGCLNSPECHCKHRICEGRSKGGRSVIEKEGAMWKEITMREEGAMGSKGAYSLQMEGTMRDELNLQMEGA